MTRTPTSRSPFTRTTLVVALASLLSLGASQALAQTTQEVEQQAAALKGGHEAIHPLLQLLAQVSVNLRVSRAVTHVLVYGTIATVKFSVRNLTL